LLGQAIADASYTIRNVPNDFPLLPAMLTTRGKTYALLDKLTEATADLQRAISLNPKYDQSYAALGDLYKKMGKMDQAKEIIQTGLKHVPNSKLLSKRAKELHIAAPHPE
jgi:tetratricopeptide (TPR) repeat protein